MGKTLVLLFHVIKYIYITDSKKIESRLWESKPNRTMKILNRSQPYRPNFHWPAYKCVNEKMTLQALLMINYVVFVANTSIKNVMCFN